MAARIVAVIVVLVMLALGGYWFLRPYLEPPPAPPPPVIKAAPETKKEPQFPIGAEAKPLPKLGESDPALRESIAGLVDPKALARFFNLEDGIRRIVATVDNLSREHLARQVNVAQPVGGQFLVTGKDDTLAIGAKNPARYNAFVNVVEAVDTQKAVAAYVYLYPLFQQAFVELGYPDAYFNDRLVEVIDHLLEAPEPKGPVKLVQPKVLYEFADPDMELMSAGHKIMVRVGPENEARLKAKLKQIREAVVTASSRETKTDASRPPRT
jgi:hypothetical protein